MSLNMDTLPAEDILLSCKSLHELEAVTDRYVQMANIFKGEFMEYALHMLGDYLLNRGFIDTLRQYVNYFKFLLPALISLA